MTEDQGTESLFDDLSECGENPLAYGQETHGELHLDALKELRKLSNEVDRLRSGSEIPALREMVSAQAEQIKRAEENRDHWHSAANESYDLNERIERVEAFLACVRAVGGNTLVADYKPEVARRILTEITRDLHEAEDLREDGRSGS